MSNTKSFGPYTPVRRAGEHYYISGQVGVDPVTGLVGSSAKQQAEQALDNLESQLQAAGLEVGHVVKTTLFLVDMDDYSVVNEVYQGFFSEPRPARSCVAVAELPRVVSDTRLLVEVEAAAYSPVPLGGGDSHDSTN